MNESPSSLIAAVRYFSDLRVCNDYMKSIKWPGGEPCCHKCGSVNVYELSTRPLLKCRDCKKQFSYKVGTIFEDSPLGLDKWFVAVWAIANCKNGISSHELGRALRIDRGEGALRLRQSPVSATPLTTLSNMAGNRGLTMNRDPRVIGYWARVHNLTRDQILEEGGTVADVLRGFHAEDQQEFMEGWNQADLELQGERMESLYASLIEAEDPARDQQKRNARYHRNRHN